MSSLNSHHNEDALSIDEHASVVAAREAYGMLKKTFESWITVGRGLHTLHLKAERIGGRQTFLRLREQAGLGEKQIQKATVTRLLQIIDNLPAVVSWRQDLTEREQFDWAGPGAIHKHCPVFAKPKDGKPKKKRTAKETTGKLAEQAARIEELEQELEGARGSGGNVHELKRLVGALKSENEELRESGAAPSTLDELRERSVPLLLALPMCDRIREINLLLDAAELGVHLAEVPPKDSGSPHRRGRKPGSKNKPKTDDAVETAA